MHLKKGRQKHESGTHSDRRRKIPPGPSPDGIQEARRPQGIIILPEGARDPNAPPVEESALAISLARAHHWLELEETGQIASLSDISESLKLDLSYLGRLMKLTLLAPDIKMAILNGIEPSGLSLAKLCKDIPVMWSDQRDLLDHHLTDPAK